MRHAALLGVALAMMSSGASWADDPIFSGPQEGEPLPSFQVRGVFDDEAGQEFDLISRADGKPVFLVFVHEANRPSIALTRLLMAFAKRSAGDDLVSGVVWLADDPGAAEQFLNRARHALPEGVPIGISVDGAEGPGAYGLNRNVTLTVLIGNNGRVKSNYALVQPSVQADAPKILASLVEVTGGEAPTAEELIALESNQGTMRRPAANPDEPDPRLAGLLRSMIQQDAEPDQVDRAAKGVEELVAEDEMIRGQLGRITTRIVDSGRIETYGTPRAREHLQDWAKRFGPSGDDESGGS